jgi:serine protease inhibitor
MNKFCFRCLPGAVLLLILGCMGPAFADTPPPADVTAANNSFGLKLFQHLSKQPGGHNLAISPLSLSMALAMTWNGADGETARAMASTLDLEDIAPSAADAAYARLADRLAGLGPDVEWCLANSLWADDSLELLPSYVERMRTSFDAAVTRLDLAQADSVARINRWIADKTRGRIPELLDPGARDARGVLYLVNAAWFRAPWAVGFGEKDTREGRFRLPDGGSRSVPMMTSLSPQYSFLRENGFSAVALPYRGETVSLYLFLPDEGIEIRQFIDGLDPALLESWFARFQRGSVTVVLPRFRLSDTHTLNPALTAMGMGVAFTDKADFSRMIQGRTSLDWVRHGVKIEVNEKGTVAGTATVVKSKGGPPALVFNRPFVLAIREVSGALLFLGCVVDPLR